MIQGIPNDYDLLPSYQKQNRIRHRNCRIQTITSLLKILGYDIDPNIALILSLENFSTVAKIKSRSKIPYCVFIPYLNHLEVNVLDQLGIDYSIERIDSIDINSIVDNIRDDKLPIIYFFDTAKLLKRRTTDGFQLGVISSAIIVGVNSSKDKVLLNALAGRTKYNPVSFVEFDESRESNLLPFKPDKLALRIKPSEAFINGEKLKGLIEEKIHTLVSQHISMEIKWDNTLYCYDISHGSLAYDSICDYLAYLKEEVTDMDIKLRLFRKVFGAIRLGICSGTGSFMRKELVEALKFLYKEWPDYKELNLLIESFNKTEKEFLNLARFLYKYQINSSTPNGKLDRDIEYVIERIKNIREIENMACINYLDNKG